MEELERFIMEDLPYNGEWWSNGCEIFIKCAKDLLSTGWIEHDIKSLLQDLYNATASEFN